MYCALGQGKTNKNELETFLIVQLFCYYPFSCFVLLRFMEPKTSFQMLTVMSGFQCLNETSENFLVLSLDLTLFSHTHRRIVSI
jgi:hypothetical protein